MTTKARKILEDVEYIKEHFFINRATDLLWRKHKISKKWSPCKYTIHTSGHLLVSVKKHPVRAHQVIWVLYYGFLPKYIDHIDRNPKNNIIGNLRGATKQTNSTNRIKQRNNTSGYKGVSFDKRKKTKPWRAYLGVGSAYIHIGVFSSKEAAAEAYNRAAYEFYGDYSCLNIINREDSN